MTQLEKAYHDLMQKGNTPFTILNSKKSKTLLVDFGPLIKKPVKVYYNSGDAMRNS